MFLLPVLHQSCAWKQASYRKRRAQAGVTAKRRNSAAGLRAAIRESAGHAFANPAGQCGAARRRLVVSAAQAARCGELMGASQPIRRTRHLRTAALAAKSTGNRRSTRRSFDSRARRSYRNQRLAGTSMLNSDTRSRQAKAHIGQIGVPGCDIYPRKSGALPPKGKPAECTIQSIHLYSNRMVKFQSLRRCTHAPPLQGESKP